MTNKYQEAFERVGENAWNYGGVDTKQCKKDLETLQELIDKTTICGLSLDEAIPVIEMYKQLKHITHQIEPIEDLMMGQKGQYYINGISIQKLIDNYDELLRLCVIETKEKIVVKKALDMLLDLSVDKESGICCTYGCPNKDIDMESGSCVGKCMTKQELKEYLFEKVRNNNENKSKKM